MNLIPTSHSAEDDNERQEIVIPVKTEHKLVGRLPIQPGHTCFEMNLRTQTVTVAKYETIASWPTSKKKLIIQPDCIYCTALNTRNAIKRFFNMLTLHHARTYHSHTNEIRQDGEHLETEPGTTV